MTHYCNTDNPTSPCCWVARRREFDHLAKMEAARKARYGSQSCPGCGKVYDVDTATLAVADHDCRPRTDEEVLAC